MLNRRHIRIKVLQSIYASFQSNTDDLAREEKYLNYSLAKIYDLYVLMLSLLIEIRDLAEEHLEIAKKKHLATEEDKNPNRKFVDNLFFKRIKENRSLATYIENYKLDHWKEDNEYVSLIWKEIKDSTAYSTYITNTTNTSEKKEIQFISDLYKDFIAPNDKLFDYFESQSLTWVDDIPFVNTFFLKNIKKITSNTFFSKDKLFKDEEDEKFGVELFRKVMLHHHEFEEDIDEKTPNWDAERIAEIDLVLIKMALTEFVYFPSIPTRVTINEYIEIAKDYSTSKSSFFINGVLDKLLKQYTSDGKIIKSGRGLL